MPADKDFGNAWENLGGPVRPTDLIGQHEPTSASDPGVSKLKGTNHEDVFVIDAEGALWTKWSPDGLTWSDHWVLLKDNDPNLLLLNTSAPASVSRASDRIDVFAASRDGDVYQTFWHNAWNTGAWNNLGHPKSSGDAVHVKGDDVYLTGGVTVTSTGPKDLDVFAVGDDQKLYYKAWDGSGWSDWRSDVPRLPGTGLAWSAPSAVSWGTGRVDIVVRGAEGYIYHLSGTGSGHNLHWASSWERLGATAMSSSPVIVSDAPNKLDVFAAEATGIGTFVLEHKNLDGGSQTSGWESLGAMPHPHLGTVETKGKGTVGSLVDTGGFADAMEPFLAKVGLGAKFQFGVNPTWHGQFDIFTRTVTGDEKFNLGPIEHKSI